MSQRHVPNTVVFKQLASLRKLEELAMKFEQAQISRKPSQVGGQTRYDRAEAKNLRWLAFSFNKGFIFERTFKVPINPNNILLIYGFYVTWIVECQLFLFEFLLGVLHRTFFPTFVYARYSFRFWLQMCGIWKSPYSQLYPRISCSSSRALDLVLACKLDRLFGYTYLHCLVEPKATQLQFCVVEKAI